MGRSKQTGRMAKRARDVDERSERKEVVEQRFEKKSKKEWEDAMDQAAYDGEIDIAFAMEQAASDGYLDVVKWLEGRSESDKGDQDYLYRALNRASSKGHLDVVQFILKVLQDNLREAIDDAMSEATGHPEVVQYLKVLNHFLHHHRQCFDLLHSSPQ